MIKQTVVLLSFLFVSTQGFTQITKIPATKMAKDDAFDKSQSILPIYKYTSDSIEPYSKFGIEVKNPKQWYKISKLPDMQGTRDTGYTYIYFSGSDNATSQGYILALVGNYVRSSRTVYFYIDRNNDFDFSNDGGPDSVTYRQESFEITLESAQVKGATYAIKLTRFKYGENVRYKNLLTEHYKVHSGKKIFTNINYCFREQRYNSVTADYNKGTDSFTIGLKDMNVNGVYNESCTDKIFVGQYKEQIANDQLFNLTPTLDKTVFEWGGKKYRIVSIESTGAFIEIKEESNATLSNKLEVGKKAPKFEYFNILNIKHSIKEFKKQEVYLYFWDNESLSADTAYLNKLNTEFLELKIIALNHGDEPKQVRITFYYDKLKFPVGYSNTDLATKYFLEDVSRGYYIGKRRKLKDDEISPEEMYNLLAANKK